MADPARAADDVPAAEPRRGTRARTVLGWLVLVAVVAVAVPVVATRWEAVEDAGGLPGPGWSAVAVAAYVVGNVVLARNWRAVVAIGGSRLPWRTAVWVWSASQLTRYTFSLAHVGGRAALGRLHGLTATAGALSTVVELGWMLAVSATLALLAAPWWLPAGGDFGWLAALAVVPTVAIAAGIAAPATWLRVADRLTASRAGAALLRGRLAGLADRVTLRRRDAAALTAWYAVNTALRHGAFVALFLGVGGATADIPAVVGALAVGNLAGALSITPGGLGAREGVTAALLTPVVGGAPALLLVAAQRALEIVAELALLGLARLGRPRR